MQGGRNRMNQLETLTEICSKFEARTEKSEHRFYKRQRDYSHNYTNKSLVDYQLEVVDAVAIHIPNHRLDDFLSMFDDRRYQDMEIRMNVPAVKKAYEHYKLLLNMCRGDNDAGY